MTLVSQIITDAYRQSNLLAIGVSPTANQITEALRYLNRILASVLGNEVGEPLIDFPIGRSGIDRPAGYPWYNTTPSNNWFVPQNHRVMLNLQEGTTLYLHPRPDNGARFGVTDILGNLSTYPVVIDGNGRNIESSSTVTLSTNSLIREWIYRADMGSWVRVVTVIESDTFPFPQEFDDFFITLLAMRINPSYGVDLDSQSQYILSRGRSQLRARYHTDIPSRSDIGLVRLSRVASDRDSFIYWSDYWGDPNSFFNRGF